MRRPRDGDDYNEVRPGCLAFFEGMQNDMIVEHIIRSNLNIYQIFKICMLLRKARRAFGDDICTRLDLWNTLFVRRFGQAEFDRVRAEEPYLADAFKRVAAYSLFALRSEIVFRRRSVQNTQIRVRLDVDGNVVCRVEPINMLDPHNGNAINRIYNDIANAYNVVKMDADPEWTLEDLNFVVPAMNINITQLRPDVLTRAIIYWLLTHGWGPYYPNGDRVWSQKCIGCNAEKPAYACKGCKSVAYCGTDCAKQHWAEHKKDCK
jgi:hypothetical protein